MSATPDDSISLSGLQQGINDVLDFHLARIKDCIEKLHTTHTIKPDSQAGYALRGQAEESLIVMDKMSGTHRTGESVFVSLGNSIQADSLFSVAQKQAKRVKDKVSKILIE